MGQIENLLVDDEPMAPLTGPGFMPAAPFPTAPTAPALTPEEIAAQEAEAKKQADMRRRAAAALKKYWANKPRAEIAKEILTRVDNYYEHLESTGRRSVLQRSYEYYYAGMIRQARLRKAGKEDEYTTIGVNHYRNNLQHIHTKTIQQRPTPEPKASNTDHKSLGQAIVARGIIDHYNREKNMERNTDRAAEEALILSEAYVSVEWDAQLGDDYADGKMGDIDINNFNATTVAYDFTQMDPSQRDWIVTIRFRNKYDYAARYPELAERIVRVSQDKNRLRNRYLGLFDYDNSDLIPVYRMYHKRTPSVPEGRFVECLSNSLVTLEGPLPTKSMNVYRIVPDEQEGSAHPYTIAFDMMPIQEAIDGLYSTILTNQSTFGVQNIAMPNGAGISVEQIVSGLNLIKYDAKAGKPEALNLTNTPVEIFKFVEMLKNLMEQICGLNSVIMGTPEENITSGAFAALIASQAIEFNTKYQKSYIQLLEDVYTGVIEILKENADTPRMIAIAGKSNRSYLKQFTGKELSEIRRVTMSVGNPLSRTTAGKMQIADTLLERGKIATAEEYLNIITTGQLEPLYESAQAQLMLIRSENEKLADEAEQPVQLPPDPMAPPNSPPVFQSSVPAILTDDHMMHIKEHMVVLASPEARMNPNIVRNTLAHINEHADLLMSGDPLLALMGQPQLAPPPDAGGGGGGGAPPNGSDGRTPTEKTADGVNQPGMPTNPVTGKEFDNQTGGLQ